MSLEFFEPLFVSPDDEHLKRDVCWRLLTTLMDQRLGHIARNGNSSSVDKKGKHQKKPRDDGTNKDHEEDTDEDGNDNDDGGTILWGGVSSRPLIKGLRCTGVSATVAAFSSNTQHGSSSSGSSDAVESGLQCLLGCCKRVQVHGFTVPELELAKTKWRRAFESQLADVNEQWPSSR